MSDEKESNPELLLECCGLLLLFGISMLGCAGIGYIVADFGGMLVGIAVGAAFVCAGMLYPRAKK